MKDKPQYFNWHAFWLMETAILCIPLFAVIMPLRTGEYVSHRKAGEVIFAWLVLSVLNFTISKYRANRSGRES